MYVLSALFRLAFATAPNLLLNLARTHNSPAHSSIGTSSGLNALWLFVSIQFQNLFTPLPRFFSPFLHSTGSLSVTEEYLVLRGGPRTFRQDSTCLAVLWNILITLIFTNTRLSLSMVCHSNTSSYSVFLMYTRTPLKWFGLFRFRSPLLTEYDFSFFSSRYLDVSVP